VPHNGSAGVGEEKVLMPLPGIQPRFLVRPARSLVTKMTELLWKPINRSNHKKKSLLEIFNLLSTCGSSTVAISTALNAGVGFLRGSNSRKTFNQGRTISGCLTAQETTFCTVTPNICTSSAWKLFHVIRLTSEF